MPVPYTAAQLKARFETGDVPTQQDFADLIDTLLHQVQQANDTAESAVALAANGAKCYALVTFTYPGIGAPAVVTLTVNRAAGGALAATFTGFSLSGTGTATLTLTPTEVWADAHMAVLTGSNNADVVPTAIVRNVGSIVLTLPLVFATNGGAQTKKFNLLAMP